MNKLQNTAIVCNFAGHFDSEIDMSSLESFSDIKVENIQLLRLEASTSSHSST